MKLQMTAILIGVLLSTVPDTTVLAAEMKITKEAQEEIAETLYQYTLYGQKEKPRTEREKVEYGPGGKNYVNISDWHISTEDGEESNALSAIGPLLRYGYFGACLPDVSLTYANGEYQTVLADRVSQKEIMKERMFLEKVNEIEKKVVNLSDKEKALALAAHIMALCEYDHSLKGNTAYDCLINGQAVCIGYASAYYHLCKGAGLPCNIITGVTKGGIYHAWNEVLVDGAWLYFDLTWEDIWHNGSWMMCTEEKIYEDRVFQSVWAEFRKES